MFGAKYSRLKFWIISIILFIPIVVLSVFVKALENSENSEEALIPSIVLFLIALAWLNTLANRIRDYGGSPWLSLLAFIPFANIIMAFYYGIVKSKKSESNETNDNTTLSKAVYNHSKDIASEIKPAINEYKENHKTTKQKQQSTIDIDEYKQNHSSTKQSEDFSNNISEDEMYEKVMIEIEEDKKVKSTWAKALAQSEGDDKKAQAIYIKLRVQQLNTEMVFSKEKEEMEIILKLTNLGYKISEENFSYRINEPSGAINKRIFSLNELRNYSIKIIKLHEFLNYNHLVIAERISSIEVVANHKSKPMNSIKIKFFDELGGYWNYS